MNLYFLFEENMLKSLNLQTHISLKKTPPPYIFYFIFSRFLRFFHTRPLTIVYYATSFINDTLDTSFMLGNHI
jgi:hypothetical protein